MRYAITYRKQNKLVAMVAMGNTGRKQVNLGKNGLIKPIFRGIEDILYDGFRKCFVNCKFTFYITLS